MDTKQRVFMIGWEYPPHNSGGLGVACEGLTQALAEQNTQIYFTLPYTLSSKLNHMNVITCQSTGVAGQEIDQLYPPFSAYAQELARPQVFDPAHLDSFASLPQSQMEAQVTAYADKVLFSGQQLQDDFGVVHAHDWMAFPAAIKLQKTLHKPMIAHVHSTEFDRIPSGGGSPYIMETEYLGLQKADRVIAVSYYTKKVLVEKYGVDASKISVVHNGANPVQEIADLPNFAPGRPLIVCMGRLTAQKGVEYFLDLAQAVIKRVPEALFIVAGNGDQYQSLLLRNAYDQLSAAVLFTGFLRDQQREALLARANIFVMPSLSEPFGLVALEAAQRNTPVIVSNNSGVKEILPGALQADFWDIEKMSHYIVRLVKEPAFAKAVTRKLQENLRNATWEKAAEKVRDVYQQM